MVKISKLTPFGRFCCTIGNLPASYMESLTYEEQLLWLCKYIEETLIPHVNANSDGIIELQNLFIELKKYVDDYFSDLNVQNEINNKLDEMAKDGTLDTIINQNIFADLNQNIEDLQNDLNNYKTSNDGEITNIKNLGYNISVDGVTLICKKISESEE